MDFPKCKICGERHRLGPCLDEQLARAMALGDAKRRERPKTSPELDAALAVLLPKANHPPAMGIGCASDRTVIGVGDAGNPQLPVKLKRGRPTITAPRPWDSEGMSRRTWYRRRKAAQK